MAQFNFNASNVAPQESFSPIPAGVYRAHVVESDVVATKSGGQMIKLTFEVLQGNYARRKVCGNINVRNANPDAERIGQSQLSALCHAVGVINLQDTAQLHQRPVMIRVKIRKDDTGQYGDRNEVSGYEAAQGVQMPVQGAGGAAFPPSMPPPAAPPQAAAASSAPWARRAAPAAQA